MNPKSATTALNLGICYLYQEKEDRALVHFKKAVQNDPKYAYAFFNLGSTYFDQGKYPLAIEALEKAIHLDPTYIASYEICAMAHLILNQKDKAEELYKKSEGFKRQARLKNVIG
ncbi:MAG: tetratricopeptide repeat protein [Deltaproteobacteria bacterium]|nr:tetratricopeptide repeat protein [Deltaproteobacteria bacterium]